MRWRSPPLCLLLLLSLFVSLVEAAKKPEFRICAYNLQSFNETKASNYKVKHTLTRILSRCDITLLQGVQDPKGLNINPLVAYLNRESDRYENFTYNVLFSEMLGNSPKDLQQYVFIYRTQTVVPHGSYQYRKKDSFVREPFALQFVAKGTAIEKFVLVPLRAEPKQAVQEINRLYDVFTEVSKRWNNTNVMFLGDFQAGCGYMTRHDRKKIRLFKKDFSWLITDKMDTTVTDEESCPFDRIVVHGEHFLKAIVPFSAKVFDFGSHLKLSKSKVMGISRHYPVEVRLKSSALPLQATPLLILLCISTIVQSFLSVL